MLQFESELRVLDKQEVRGALLRVTMLSIA
jgi:hypothetical protein